MSSDQSSAPNLPSRQLSLWDTTSIIVGIIIGSSIYEISPTVAAAAEGWTESFVSGPWQSRAATGVMLGVWLLGGLIALLGAMCYAELATAHPRAGGTYAFLAEAFGKTFGFAFAWVEFWIVRPGNVGAVAFVLARYAATLLPDNVGKHPQTPLATAAAAVIVLSVINALGVRAGKWTQNALTAVKVAGLVAIIATALTLRPDPPDISGAAQSPPPISLALILVMFAYGGWSDMSFVAAEVREPRKNIFRALLLGTATVTAIYLAINQAFIVAMGLDGLTSSSAIAADVLSRRFGALGSTAISLLVVISCLGAINGMIFTGARVFYALGTEHPTFRWLGAWNRSRGVPLRSLVVQTLVMLALVIAFGRGHGGFNRLVVFTGPFYWGFFAMVGIALMVLRLRGGGETGTYRVPLFPLTPLLFFATSGLMVVAAMQYIASQYIDSERAWEQFWPTTWAIGVVVSGVLVGTIDWWIRRKALPRDASTAGAKL
jgi:amino acid transporter